MSTPRWLQHPVTVFLVPLIILLCLPQIYKFLPSGTDPSFDVTKLQVIASLMGDIYDTLANSTFIPHNAITRGPHAINTPAIPCRPSASVLQLIELLPYVDLSLLHEPDWIYGGHFMDYRNPEHIAELCDPLRGQSIGWTDYMEPSDVALTNWGTGGWNNDRTWVMIYNTDRDSIRIFDAELWVDRQVVQQEFKGEMNDWWFEDNGDFVWDRAGGASHVLRAVMNNYKSLKWTPWGTSNRDNGFGAPSVTIKDLLQRNGWPNAFDIAHFNVEFIRTKHNPSAEDDDEAAQKRNGIPELVALQRTHEEAMYTNDTKKCVHRRNNEVSNDPLWLEKCIANKATQRKWLDLALEQSQEEALAFCKETGCEPPPFEDVFQRAQNKIAEFEQLIKDRTTELIRMDAEYQSQLPDLGEEAQIEFERETSLLANSKWYIRDEIDTLKEEMAKLERGETAEVGRKWLFDYLRDYEY
ncbi:hypothetical protein OPT61_g6055 [Boeremia exigua]|uniref:Uncharacterized protein n=1 Tax=Boeremia exigua TaxID=749465 RepID=A0ACC2I812_9PLEO|nr:hypothetical protein OPT61_g6055 [Boeremia exigua]